MTNGEVVLRCGLTLVLSALFLLLLAIVTAEIKSGWNMTNEQPADIDKDINFGRTIGYARIYFRTETLPGAAPIDAINATIAQMQYEQSTPLGSDANARALVKVLEAKAILEGRSTETADGIPIIE
jgi:hypothetical protein